MADRSARLAFILSLTDKVSAPLGKVKTTFSDLAAAGEANIKQMGLGLGGMIGAAKGITASLEPALEVNRALGEVRSLSVAEDALSSLNRKALEFSVSYGTSAQSFVSSAYDIQSAIAGLVGEQLSIFTNASNVLAKATKADAATITSYVGTMYGIFKTQADSMGKAQWVENLAGQTALAVQMFKTTGQQMSDAFTAVGASATSAGIGLSEQIGILGTLQATMGGGEAGTQYKAFLSGVGGAQKELGLQFTDTQGRMLPMLQILDKLKGKFGETLSVADSDKLKKAFGSDEAVGLIKLLMNDTAGLANNIDQLGKIRGMENAEKMAQAMVDPWQQFGAAVQALRIAFGQALIPMLTPLMEKLVAIASTLTRWTQMFPNITRVIGITTLVVFGLIAAMSAMTLVVGMSKMVWLSMVTIWKVLTWTGFRSIAMFLYHTVMISAFVVGMVAMYTWMGLVRGAMLLWQGAIWLVNAAMLANPVLLIVAGIIALAAVVVAAIVYWDQWTAALMNSAAFQWVSAKLQALSDWFGSIGGWSGMASAAWDGIVAIFKSAISSLIDLLNKIPGVQIDASFGDMPKAPELPGISAPLVATPQVPQLVSVPSLGEQADQTRERITANTASISPLRPNAVPAGGLLRSIQNTTNNQTQQGIHVENLTIKNDKPMTPLELENMVGMAVSG